MIKTNYQVDSYKTNTLYYDANNVFFHLNDVERRNKPFLAVFSKVHFVHRANNPFDFQHFCQGGMFFRLSIFRHSGFELARCSGNHQNCTVGL